MHVAGGSTSNGANIVQYPFTGDTHSQWMITLTADSHYRISPRSAPSLALSLPSGSNEGTTLQQITYTNNSEDSDEWILRRRTNYIQINVQMDYGYIERYGSFENAHARIQNNLTTVGQKYLEDLEIWIDFSSIEIFTSYADECPASYDEYCSCGPCVDPQYYPPESEYHHTNAYNILRRTSSPDPNTTALLSFIGNKVCDENLHADDNNPGKLGLANKLRAIMIVMDHTTVEREIQTTIHEIGHMFNAPDHYDQYWNSAVDDYGEIFNNMCIFGDYRHQPNIISNLTICSGCQEIILQNRTRFSN